jgi:hypothetical protein
MKRITITILILAITAQLGIAQNEVEALRYSRTTFGGTARYMAMAGAFGSLGADFSTLSSNPGGIGLYKKSEFSFTPAVFTGKTNSIYNETSAHDTRTVFNISNVGIIYASPQKRDKNAILQSMQFAFGLNRINDFNNRMIIEGYNSENSLIDTYVESADGIFYEDIEDDYYGYYSYDLNPAWNTFMIDTISGQDDLYYGITSGDVWQRKEINAWGSTNEMVFSMGANLAERVYLGVTLGVPFLRYREEVRYYEEDIYNLDNDFTSLRISDQLETNGTGFNVKFGVIVRATNWLRLGGAIHSPTWYSGMKDYWSTEFYNQAYGTSYSIYYAFGPNRYSLQTPWRANGSLSFIIGNKGLISADYEYVDFAKAKFTNSDFYGYNFSDENQKISHVYDKTHNVRVGAEYRIGSIALRGGFGYYGSPFAKDENGVNINDGEKYYYSGGLGYRNKNFFTDLAYVGSQSEEDYYLYGTEDIVVNPVRNQLITHNFLWTIGFRF